MRKMHSYVPFLIVAFVLSAATAAIAVSASDAPIVTLSASPATVSPGGTVSFNGTITPALSQPATLALESQAGLASTWTPVGQTVLGTGATAYVFPLTRTVNELTRFRVLLESSPGAVSASEIATVSVIPRVMLVAPARAPLVGTTTITATVQPFMPGEIVTITARSPAGSLSKTSGPVGADGRFVSSRLYGVAGRWRFTFDVGANAVHEASRTAASTLMFRIHPRITLVCAPKWVRPGGTAKLSGSVLPRLPRRLVNLQRQQRGKWVTFAKVRTDARSKYALAVRPALGTTRYRAQLPKARDVYAAVSPARPVITYVPIPRLRVWVSNPRPGQNTDLTAFASVIDQHGQPSAGASVKFTWRYKSGPRTATVRTSADGVAQSTRNVGGATVGVRFVIDVAATWESYSLSASTSFVPQ